MPRLQRLVAPILFSALVAVVLSPSFGQTCDPGIRGALNFDGVDDYVKIPNNVVLDGMANFTFELWFRATTNGPTFRALLDKGGSFPYLIGLFTNVAVFLEGNQVVLGQGNILDNQWHHLAVTGNGPSVTCYLDGGAIASGTYGNPLNSGPADLYIGAAYSGSGTLFYDHWSGGIDEIRIWNVARTAAQIEGNRLYTLSGSEPGLVAYYKCDTTSGQTLVNSVVVTGAAIDGVLGSSTSSDPEDPIFTTSDFTPMFYCVSGTGQPNSAAARLQVNGAGTGTGPGPFNVSVNGGSNLTLAWTGPATGALILAAGPLNTNNFTFGCVGKIDIGSGPYYSDLDFLFDGQNFPGNLLYVLSSGGTATQVFSVPQAASGASATFQGIVIQPGGSPCPLVLTAAFKVTVL